MNRKPFTVVFAWIVGAFGLCALAASSIIYFHEFSGPFADKQETWGQFGDYIGGVLNPIFGLLTLGAVLGTFLMQRQELELTRQQADQAKRELESEKEARERQQFEAMFFQLLHMHRDAVKAISKKKRDLGDDSRSIVDHHGDEAIDLHLSYFSMLAYEHTKAKFDLGRCSLQQLDDSLERLRGEITAAIGQYFKVTETLLTFIDNGPPAQRRLYATIFFSLLSNSELTLLLLGSLFLPRRETLRPLLVAYQVPLPLIADKRLKAVIERYDQCIRMN